MNWVLQLGGLFGGTCLGILLGRFTLMFPPEKAEKFAVQWDIGNTFVGASTALVALVTLHLARKSAENAANHKIADYRMKWIEELRSESARYLSLVRELCAGSHVKQFNLNFDYYQSKTAELDEVGNKIKFRLNPNEHEKIIDEITILYNRTIRAIVLNTSENKSKEEIEESKILSGYVRNLTATITEMLHEVEKQEWRKVKSEVRKGK